LNHRSITMEKNHARGSRLSPLLIVHADPIALDELPHGWIFSFCYDREHKVPGVTALSFTVDATFQAVPVAQFIALT
jgi:hypothetical protein